MATSPSIRTTKPPQARVGRPISLVPPQHGAWAFLGLPVVVGLAVATWSPLIALLAVAWTAAYPASYFVLAIVTERSRRHRRPRRFVRPLIVWTIPALSAAIALVWVRPWLVWVGACYLVAFAVNARYAHRRDDRALANDAVFITECAAMVLVTWGVGTGVTGWWPPGPVPESAWILAVAVALLLTASTLHVKSLIRERNTAAYATAARAMALGSVFGAIALAFWWGLPSGAWLVIPFVFVALRSFVLPVPTRPGAVGIIELVGFLLLAAAAFLA